MVLRILDDDKDLDLELKTCVLQMLKISEVLNFHNNKIEALENEITSLKARISELELDHN